MNGQTKNIMVTNFENSGQDVMIFTESLTVESITKKLKEKRKCFTDIFASWCSESVFSFICAAACIARVDFPIPGSPPRSIT